ncbi:hypothetical protein [uncultured Lutibacter sp.]|uniref:MORN repeat-containing protein n=1 Tax=uncultured Lutibacter sp. TaxID=437739 RepID=UPI0026172156|nr:hypothetical protein [uncultured Lutibacter sp.]
MKHKSILLIALVNLFSFAFAQNIDWQNAPVNPLPKGANLKTTQLKGDVFQEYYSFYDTNGNELDFNNSYLIKRDQKNRPITYTYPDGKTTAVTYDADGNLINDEGRIYEYDNYNRIIKATFSYQTIEYSYQKQDDLLMVTIVSKSKDKAPTTKIEYYKNGLLTAKKLTLNSEKTFFKYKYDEKGNWVTRIETNAAGNLIKQYTRSIIYHSEYKDFNKNAILKKTTGNQNLKGGLAKPYLYINGKLDNTNLFGRFNNDYIFFNPLTSTYYIAPNAFDESISLNNSIPFKPLINVQNIIVSDGKTAICIEEGKTGMFSNRKWEVKTEYRNIIITDAKSDDVYFAENAFGNGANNGTTAYPAISMTNKGSEVWYILNQDKSRIAFYHKGKKVPVTSKGFIANSQDQVYAVNGVATYVAQDYSNAKPMQFNKGRIFDYSNDKLATTTINNNINTSQKKSSTTSCTSGNCTDGYGTYTYESGAKVEGFFKNGKLNGYGEFIYANGDTYSGNYLEGQLDGYGIYHWKQNNLHYYGHWKNTKQHGYGYFVKNGETVEAGIYTNGQLTTNLLTAFQNKKNNGTCLGDCTNGYGSITYNQGDVYEGLFKDGKPYKAGTYMWTNGNSYMGDWDDLGKINNSGQFFTSSFVYKGAFAHNGFITGLGVKLDKKTNLITYGEFKEGKLVVDYANRNTSTNSTNITSNKKSNYKYIGKVDIGSRKVSPEVRTFINSFNKNQDNISQHITDLGQVIRENKAEGESDRKVFLRVLNEIYNVNKYLAFRTVMAVDKKTLDYVIANVPKDMRDYFRQEAKYFQRMNN